MFLLKWMRSRLSLCLFNWRFLQIFLSIRHQEFVIINLIYLMLVFVVLQNLQFKKINNKMHDVRNDNQYQNGVTTRRRKLQITTTNKVQTYKKQHYQDINPYSLNRNPSTPFLQKTPTTPDTLSNRDTLTQTSSQKSAKIVRTNGLTKAEKPNISKSRVIDTTNIANKLSGSRINPNLTNLRDQVTPTYQQYGYNTTTSNYSGHSNNNTLQKNPQRNNQYLVSRLSQQNSLLQQQNLKIKQQILRLQRNHNQQINALKQQMDRVFHLVYDLEERLTSHDRQWENFCQQQKKR